MIIKPRFEPSELKLLKFFNRRMNLSVKESNYFLNLEKGFEGEQVFDLWLSNLSENWLILNDLMLEFNNTFFQIDSILISQDTVYLFEVKNYEGDYYIEDDKWYTMSGTEIKNPLLQLQRTESLFRRLLQDFGFSHSLEAYLAFVNPEFFLYQATKNLPIIFPTQINSFLKKLNLLEPRSANKTARFVEKLSAILLKESPYKILPVFKYDQLKKGITCSSCHAFVTNINRYNLICEKCGKSEEIESAVLRNIDEYQFLFPDKKITTSAIYEWCKVIKSNQTIRRILKKNYILTKYGQSAYFEIPQVKKE